MANEMSLARGAKREDLSEENKKEELTKLGKERRVREWRIKREQ